MTEAQIAENQKTANDSFWPRDLVLGLLPLLLGLQLLVWIAYVPVGLHGVVDFRSLYTSGYLLRIGEAHNMYNAEKVLNIQQQLVPLPAAMGIRMDHPSYEALLFLPLSYLPYRAALLIFMAFNVLLVSICIYCLGSEIDVLQHTWKFLPACLFAAFFPITRAIVQGQDSVIVLGLSTAAYLNFRRNRPFGAGILLGLALFKFQIILPVVVLMIFWKRWRFVIGFVSSAALVGVVSLAVVGFSGTKEYYSMLLDMSLRLRSQADALKLALSPRTMLNLRGLLSAFMEGHVGHLVLQVTILVFSLCIILLAVRCRPSFPTALLASALVSYHMNAQDASPLIIPIALAMCTRSKIVAVIAVLALIIPFAAIWPLLGYLGAVPFLALFIANYLHGPFERQQYADSQ